MHRYWRPPINYFLLPFSGLYWSGLQVWYLYDKFRRKVKFDAFTVVVGNLTVGGTGKSPFVYLLAKILREEFRVVVITRGYGRKSSEPLVLSDKLLPVELTGDEPLMNFIKLEEKVPFVICKDRIKAYKIAKREFSPHVVILDDAFQYRKVVPDFSFLVFDERFFSMSRFLLPAGPLREPLKAGERANAIVLNYKTGVPGEEKIYPDKPHIRLRYKPVALRRAGKIYDFDEIEREVAAFAGIGDPESFIKTLEGIGFKVKEFKRFPDHYWYKLDEIKKILEIGLPVITTEKDYVKLPDTLKDKIYALVIEPEIFEGGEIIESLKERIRDSIG